MKNDIEEKKFRSELAKDREKEERDEDKRRHKEFLKELERIKKSGEKVKKPEPKKQPAKEKKQEKEIKEAAKEAKPATKAAEAKPQAPKPETKAAETKPVETKPVEAPKQTATKGPETKATTSTATKESTPTGGTLSSAAKVARTVAVAGGLVGIATDVISKEEGLPKKGKAYWDPPNQKKLVSIGYGHQITEQEYKQGYIQAGDEQIKLSGERGIDTVMTPEQSKKLLSLDLPKYEKRAKDPLGDSWNKLNDTQKSALISYAYNTGSTSSLVKAGLKDAINSGNMEKAASIIEENGIKTAGGNYLKVLDDRRHKEAALFRSGITKEITTTQSNTGQKLDSESKQNADSKKNSNSTIIIDNSKTMIAASGGQQPIAVTSTSDRRPLV
jgi:GH24 family phage-related lysozyme (muramidase)